MTDAAHIAEPYIAAWNDSDAQRLASAFSPTPGRRTRLHVDPIQRGEGLDEISFAMIGAVHDRFLGFHLQPRRPT